MKTLYLITARGGSKGVPGKNARIIGGRSLIQWKADAVRPLLRAGDRLVISTEDRNLADLAMRCGVDVPFQRPAELASDTASSASVIRHALDSLPGFSVVVLLEPSAPFTTDDQYRRALQMMDFNDADLVVGMKYASPHTAFIGDVRDDQSVTPIIMQFQRMARRRQDFAPQWTPSGGLYVFRSDMFLRTDDVYGGNRCYGLLQDRWTGLEIDTPEDFELAEYAYSKGYVASGVKK